MRADSLVPALKHCERMGRRPIEPQTGRSGAGRARLFRKPGARAGGDRRGVGDRGWHARAQSLRDDRRECGHRRGTASSLCFARRRQTRGGPRRLRLRPVRMRFASISAASTGGFTEVLLLRGAARVYAVDVGHSQLHPKIAGDPRVVSLESTDARKLDASLIPEPVDLAGGRCEFHFAETRPACRRGALKPGAALAVLVKPQFEAGRDRVKKGIVRDEAVHRAVCEDMTASSRAWIFRARPGAVPHRGWRRQP